MVLVGRLAKSVGERGVGNTLRLAVRSVIWGVAPGLGDRVERSLRTRDEIQFDDRHGTNTLSVREGPMPDVAERENPGTQYEATTSGALRLVVRHADLRPGNWAFVDIGSGKGKVLLLAAQMGFREVVGIEHSETLATIAESNIARFRERCPTATRITSVRGDALHFGLPHGPVMIWLYNPFGAELMSRFVARLEDHVRNNGSAMRVAYSNPLHAGLFDDSPVFERMACVETLLQGTCLVYSASP